MSSPSSAPRVIKLADVAPTTTELFVGGHLVVDSLNLIEGLPGMAKTMLAYAIGAGHSQGSVPPDGYTPKRHGVLVLTNEDSRSVVQARFKAAGADLDKVMLMAELPGQHGRGTRPLDLERDQPLIADVVEEHSVGLMLIDALTTGLGDRAASAPAVAKLMAAYRAMAESLLVTIIAIRHLRKDSSGPAILHGAGHLGTGGAARAIARIDPDPDDSDRRVLSSVKLNVARGPVALSFHINDSSAGPTIEFLGPSKWTAEDLRAIRSPGPSKRDVARTFLIESLTSGPRLRHDLVHEIDQTHGIGERTLESAKADLSLEDRQIPITGRRGRGPSWWALPGSDWD